MAELKITYADGRTRLQPLRGNSWVLGREPTCEVPLDDVSTSRRHAQIKFEGGKYFIEDLASKNGTLVNDLLAPKTPLSNGDTITLGTVKIAFFDSDAGSTTSVIVSDTLVPAEASSFSTREEELRLSQQRLKMLYDLSDRLLTLRHRDELLSDVMDICLETLHFERGAIAIRKANSRGVDWPVVRNLYGRSGELTISRTILGRALDRGERAIINETDSEALDPTVSMVQHGIRSAMCVPLTTGGKEVLGVIYGDRLSPGQAYRDEDVDFLAALARQVTIGLINARLLEEQKDKIRLENEIALAREIQCQLFPTRLPSRDNLRIAALNEPGRHVSGDYYDAIELPDGRIALIVADVTGEGVAASLLMANLQAAVRVTLPMSSNLPDALRRWNKLIYDNTEADKFATCLLGLIDPAARTLELASAGHLLPFAIRSDPRSVVELEVETDLPLGVSEDVGFSYRSHALGPTACTLFLYTDGVNEAMNEQGQFFGMDGLRSVLHSTPELEPGVLVKHVRNALHDFRGAAPQSDDITMLAVSLT